MSEKLQYIIQAEPEATADPTDILHRAMAADAATIAAGRGKPHAPGPPAGAAGPQLGAAGPFVASSPVGDINAAVLRAQMRLETQAAATCSKVILCSLQAKLCFYLYWYWGHGA